MNRIHAELEAGGATFGSRNMLRRAASLFVAAQLACFPLVATEKEKDKPAPSNTATATATSSVAASDPLLGVMQAELARAKTELSKSDPAPYFLSYTVYDQDQIVIAGSYGGLLTNSVGRRRSADVTMRVGSTDLDNTHGQSRPSGMTSGVLPLNGDADATARVLWELTDRAYKRSAAAFRKYPDVYFASVFLQISTANERMVSSEGTAVTSPGSTARMVIEAQTRA